MTNRGRVRAAVIVAGVAAVVTALVGSPAQADDISYVKYYTATTSYQGAPENLSEIATRFLGASSRAVEIYNLNVGRQQADGAALTDANKLDPGWELVLPWDAVGAGVQYGSLPTKVPATLPGTPLATPGIAGTPLVPAHSARPAEPGGITPVQPASPASGKLPAVPPSSAGSGGTPAGSGCAPGTPAGKQPDWARQTVDAAQAWSRTKGSGELVAVVDSGIDGSLTPLAGHVSVGVDVVSGSGRGDVDCLGTGTGMGAIIAAQPGDGGALAGIAPAATVMPVRVVTTAPHAQTDDEATAITVATASGATVIALGSYVDTSNAKVVDAIKQAVDHDVVVVCAAPASSVPVPADALPTDGVLRVGGVSEAGQPIASYRPGSVDVAAPGGSVSTLGLTGTGTVVASGTQYAVAFVAGEAALIRAAYPSLPAAGVADRIKQTAKPESGASGGAKMMDPGAAVTTVVTADEKDDSSGGGPVSSVTSGRGRVILLALIGVVLLIALGLMATRIRRLLRANVEGDETAYLEDGNSAG
ncbi:hypothetical protein GCM10023322_08480 [Rugosimonospora acidiphila]|uniref:Peptidase S8/S53 domain-containing protein n=1 Tax=Rugosimonospora acidiphila TaxID=556531 RepID=A0ABP9RJY1_9ACTN